MRLAGNSHVPDWFTPHDARILGRLRTGMALQAELSGASAQFHPVALRLFAAPLSDRLAIADEWLRDCPDAEAIRRAVIDTDPTQPLTPDAGPGAADNPSPVVARLDCAADIEPLVVEWLWTGRVPLGMLTMFAGDPKLGKSYVTLAMAAAVSRGAPMPCGDVPDGPASVIIMSAEDDASRTIVPRLIAAGADLSKVHILRSVSLGDGVEAPPCLATDLRAIEAAAAGLGDCRLILIDPITAYLGGVDDHRNADLRNLLAPLGDMAERLRIAIVLINHLCKSGGANGKHRVMGSMAYVGVCRANLIFVRDRTDPTGRRVLLCDNGGNLAASPPTLAFTIEERQCGPCVVFLPEPVAITTEQALAEEVQGGNDRESAPERREAELWLREILNAGPLPAKDVEDAARSCGFTMRTLRRAREALGIVAARSGFGKGSTFTWRLPDDPPGDAQAP